MVINTLSGLRSLAFLFSVTTALGFDRAPFRSPTPRGKTIADRNRMSHHDETFEPVLFNKRSTRFDASEDNEPRRGRPGIVVFSGGTAFNAASGRWEDGVEVSGLSNQTLRRIYILSTPRS